MKFDPFLVVLICIVLMASQKPSDATIVLLKFSTDGVAVAADSRENDGEWKSDDVCKVIELDPQTFFFSTGSALLRDQVTRTELWSTFAEARKARQIHSDLGGDGFLRFIATWTEGTREKYQSWIQYLPGSTDQIAQGIFGHLDGVDISVYQVVMLKTFSLIRSVTRKTDRIENLLIKYGDEKAIPLVEEFFAGTSDRAKQAMGKFRERFPDPSVKDYDANKLKSAIDFAIGWIGEKRIVGGQVDAMFLNHYSSIEWISKKTCSRSS